ncbi:MAG: regulatory protein RecX [Alloprevotella sp.]
MNNPLFWAAKLCAAREYCSDDIRRKLIQKGIAPKEADVLCRQLAEKGFVNDQRYARAYASDKFRFDHWGRVKIRFMLRSKRVSEELIDEAIAAIDEEAYLEALGDFLIGRLKSRGSEVSEEDALKVARSAINRGYEGPLVAKVMKDRVSKFLEELDN